MSINRLLYDKNLMNGIVTYVGDNIPTANLINNDGNIQIIKNPSETVIDLQDNINIKQLQINDDGNNILIGKSNGLGNYNGNLNINIGNNSGMQDFEGILNIGLGLNSLSQVINGDKNIGVGPNSLADHINGSNNIAVGEFALGSNLTGNDNIALGRYAAFKSSLIASGTFNSTIAIGTRPQVNNSNSGIIKFADADNTQYPPSNWFWFGDPDYGWININTGNVNCADISCNNVILPLNNYKRGTQTYPTNTINHNICYSVLLENNLNGYLNYTSDSVNGDYITFLKAGTYSINASLFTSVNGGGNVYTWFSRNTANTTSFASVNVNDLLTIHKITNNDYGSMTWIGHISANDIIKVNASNIGPNTAAVNTMIEITCLNTN